MSCTSKWCQWINTLSTLAVATVLVYSGMVVNSHMESWTKSFERGSDDLHSIRTNMNTISYSVESINTDMYTMNSMTVSMEEHIHELNNNITTINQQMYRMNGAVGNMSNNFSPQGMARSFMPF